MEPVSLALLLQRAGDATYTSYSHLLISLPPRSWGTIQPLQCLAQYRSPLKVYEDISKHCLAEAVNRLMR